MNKKILIIEDEPTQVATIELSVKRVGFDVVVATDGKEGLEKARIELPDLIVLDLVLPKIDGVSILKQLRASDSTSKIPILVLTNLSGSDTIKEVMDSGATDYLIKTDYTLDQLVEKIKKILE